MSAVLSEEVPRELSSTLEGSEKDRLTLAGLATFTGLVFLVLLALSRSLRLPSAYGIEDFLGWQGPDVLRAAWAVWYDGNHGGWVAAVAYVLIDTGVFLGCYPVLMLAVFERMRSALSKRDSRFGRWFGRLPGWPAQTLVIALVVADLLENYGGIRRLAAPMWLFWAATAAAIVLGCSLHLLVHRLTRWERLWARTLVGSALLIVVALLLTTFAQRGMYVGIEPLYPALSPSFPDAGRWKYWLAIAIGVLVFSSLLFWWLGAGYDIRKQVNERAAQARRRSRDLRLVGRSRYVLVMLLVFAALQLGMDQSRDVVLALADIGGASLSAQDGSAQIDWKLVGWQLIVLVVSALAIGMFSYSCWLWTRLACIAQRPGMPQPASWREAAESDAFARLWARFLATVPLAINCLLVAVTVGDAALAARRQPQGEIGLGWIVTISMLILFAIGTVRIGMELVLRRRHGRLEKAISHYGSVADHGSGEDLRRLLWLDCGEADAMPTHEPSASSWIPWWRLQRRRVVAMPGSWLRRPATVPVVALVLMLGLRAIQWRDPELAAWMPLGLAIMIFALTWWLGVLGALSLFEQQRALPFVLVPLLLVGLFSWFGWADHHRLFPGQIPAVTSPELVEPALEVLRVLRRDGFVVTVVLTFGCIVIWGATVLSADRLRLPPRLLRAIARWPLGFRLLVSASVIVIMVTALAFIDGRSVAAADVATDGGASATPIRASNDGTRRDGPSGTVSPPAPASSSSSSSSSSSAEGRTADPPVFLVAAEGGGMRSAYWTAKALHKLTVRLPEVRNATFVLSGVSGGSLGIAVFRACQRQVGGHVASENGREEVGKCIDRALTRIDSLSPLLGGLLFEDVIGSLLPTKWFCDQPGCGHLSRGLLFEREWIRVLPELTVPMPLLGRQGSQVVFNSTWVESGNRTIASTMDLRLPLLPSATRLQDCLGFDLSLIAAAHSSARFPYVNPLASVDVTAWSKPIGCKMAGHLVDGGLFDNSGVTSLRDYARLVRTVIAPEQEIRAILIRNGQSEPECASDPGVRNEPPAECFETADEVRVDATKLEMPLDRRRWDLFANEFGPLMAILNVSGVGAHGRQEPAQLRNVLDNQGERTECLPVLLVEQMDAGELVPLGWYLSGPARKSLDAQLERVFRGFCLKERDGGSHEAAFRAGLMPLRS